MKPEDELVLFLEKNPGFFELCKDALAMHILEKLGSGSKSIAVLKKSFPNERDRALRLALKKLVEAKAAVAVRLETMDFYAITPDCGKELLCLYKKTGGFFIAK